MHGNFQVSSSRLNDIEAYYFTLSVILNIAWKKLIAQRWPIFTSMSFAQVVSLIIVTTMPPA